MAKQPAKQRRRTTIDWGYQVRVLEDLREIVPVSHDLTVSALIHEYSLLAGVVGGRVRQKMLVAKLAAETVSTLEDLGAVLWAVRRRGNEGIVARYLSYGQRNVEDVYKAIDSGTGILDLLRLPKLSAADQADLECGCDLVEFKLAMELCREAFEAKLLGTKGRQGVLSLVNVYNKVKHGFVMVEQVERIAADGSTAADWKDFVNILARQESGKTVRVAKLEFSDGFIDQQRGVIAMAGRCWHAIATLIIFAWQRGYSLELEEEGS